MCITMPHLPFVPVFAFNYLLIVECCQIFVKLHHPHFEFLFQQNPCDCNGKLLVLERPWFFRSRRLSVRGLVSPSNFHQQHVFPVRKVECLLTSLKAWGRGFGSVERQCDDSSRRDVEQGRRKVWWCGSSLVLVLPSVSFFYFTFLFFSFLNVQGVRWGHEVTVFIGFKPTGETWDEVSGHLGHNLIAT